MSAKSGKRIAISEDCLIRSYSDLVLTLRKQRQSLKLPHLQTDMKAGLHAGYTGKIECGLRKMGPVSLPCLLEVLGVSIVLVTDDGRALARVKAERSDGYRPSAKSLYSVDMSTSLWR